MERENQNRLKSWLNILKKKKKTIVTREPRKNIGYLGKLLQQILQGKIKIPGVALQYIMTAERAIHQEEIIVSSLKKGKVIISDRCFWSAIPYGIFDKGQEFDENTKVILAAQSILSMYHQFIIPDITFYLDISPEEAVSRFEKEQNHKEKKEIYEETDHLKKILMGYKWLLREFANEFTIINGRKPIDEVTKNMIKIIEEKMLINRSQITNSK